MRILVVEDDRKVARFVQAGLEQEGHAVDVLHEGSGASEQATAIDYDVVVLDLMLLISEFARRHIDRNAKWGRIIGVTSGGPGGFPGEVSYGAAKAALENYTMSAAQELAKRA